MTLAGHVRKIWIYPTKSLAPTQLDETVVGQNGLDGDRVRALLVRSEHPREGKPYRGKEDNHLHLTADPQRARDGAAERGIAVSLEHDAEARFFDSMPVSVLFDTWVGDVSRAVGVTLDPQRWRPNFFAEADAAFTLREPAMIDRIVEVGDVVLRVAKPIHRCVVTTYDVQTGEPNGRVLRYVAQERDNTMGVYCVVERAGTVRAGDALRLRAR